MSAQPTLSSQQVVELAQVTYRQLDHWTRVGVLGGDLAPVTIGSGNRRRYTLDDARVVLVLGAVARLAARLDVLARLAQSLRELDDFSGLVFCTPDGQLHRALHDDFDVALLLDLDHFATQLAAHD